GTGSFREARRANTSPRSRLRRCAGKPVAFAKFLNRSHRIPVRPSRSQRDHHLPASFATSPPGNREPSGLAETERQVHAGGVDEPAAPRGGRSHLHRSSCLPRTKPPTTTACRTTPFFHPRLPLP